MHPTPATAPLPFHHDARLIQALGAHTVLAQRHEVMFKDGLAVGLHPVLEAGAPHTYWRAVHAEGLCWLLFDLRHLSTEIEADLKMLKGRDHPGAVFYTLRGLYPTRKAFTQAVFDLALQRVWPNAATASAA